MDKDFGPYELRERIGKGGMAWVYLANQKNLDRPVALKILFPHLAEDEKLVARFQLEARSAAQMRHENVCQVYDFGRHGEQFYIAMEYVEGLNLRDWIDQKGTPPLEIALLMLRDICRGLEHAHRRNIVHRDIKPSNVMFTPEGVIKLMDFGLARRAEDTTGITMVGAMLGTPAYMSPEQARGERLDRATTDIFSFGIVCYELMSGMRPFQGDTSSIARAILYAEPRPLDALDPLVPPGIEAMIRGMLEKDATRRVQTVTEVRTAFDMSIAALGISHERGLLGDYAADPEAVGGALRARRLARHLEDAREAEAKGDEVATLRAWRCVHYLDPHHEAAARYVRENDVPWPGSDDPEVTQIYTPGSSGVHAGPDEVTMYVPPDQATVVMPPGAAGGAGVSRPPATPPEPELPVTPLEPQDVPSAATRSPVSIPPVAPSVPPRSPSMPPASPPPAAEAPAIEREPSRPPKQPTPPPKQPTPPPKQPTPPPKSAPAPKSKPAPQAGAPIPLLAGIGVAVLAIVGVLIWQPWKGPAPPVAPPPEPVEEIAGPDTTALPIEVPVALVTLRVVTTPPDAQVSLDGGEYVPAPALFEGLEARDHTVRIRRDSFQVARRVVPLAAGRDTTLTITLKPAVAGGRQLALLIVNTDPAGATVVLDGERTETSPARFRNLAEGEHTLEVRRDGYTPRTLALVARAAAETTLAITLAPAPRPGVAPRTVTVRTKPGGGMVSLNGSPSRRAPTRFDGVGPGEHALRVRLASGQEVQTRFPLSGLRDTTLTIELALPEPEGPTATLVLWARPPSDFYVEKQLKGKGLDSVRVTVAANKDHHVYIKEPTAWFGESAQNTVRPKPGEVKYVGRDFTGDGGRLDVDTPGRPGAEVLVDGRHTGRFTPATLWVKEGTHKVHVVAEGWKTREGEQTLRFKAGQPRAQSFTLEPQ